MAKNGVLACIIVQESVSIEPAPLTVSSSFTYCSLGKHEVSRRMKGFATSNATHAIHHKKDSNYFVRNDRGALQTGSKELDSGLHLIIKQLVVKFYIVVPMYYYISYFYIASLLCLAGLN